MFHKLGAGVALVSLVLTASAHAQMRKVAYQADGYTVYLEKTGYCSLFLDTPRGAMVRISYQADGTTNFSYVRRGLALDPSTPSYTALFSFDGSRDLMGYAAADTQLDDGRAGFMLANAGGELLDNWANARSVTIRLSAVTSPPFDTISLQGAAPAIMNLRRCAQPGFSDVITPTIMPAPPPSESTDAVSSSDRRFPTGERISLAYEPEGIGGTGTITHRAPGQPTKTVSISYMREFGAIVAPDRIQYNVAGVTRQGEQTWSCEATIDWRTARIVSARDLSRFAHPPCTESAGIAGTAMAAPARPSPSPAVTPKPGVTRALLVGAWVDDLRGCDGDTATQYAAAGTWIEGGNSGTWSLDGDRLTVVTTETYGLGEEAPPRRLNPPETMRWTVTKIGPNKITYAGKGKHFTLVKCPNSR